MDGHVGKLDHPMNSTGLEDFIEFKLNNFKVTTCSIAPFNLIVYDLMKILVPHFSNGVNLFK